MGKKKENIEKKTQNNNKPETKIKTKASSKAKQQAEAKGKVEDKVSWWGTGRRKSAVARVRLFPGNGNIYINGRRLEEYFGVETVRDQILKPLESTGNLGRFDVIVKVVGGGLSGQAGAVQHGLSRALLQMDEGLRLELKKLGFLTRDPREKERKKYGLKKARKRPQFSKR